MKETQRRHALERDNLLIELDDMTKDTEKISIDGPERSNRFQFYQNLRGYVTDLVECFDEKVGSIFNLLNSWGQRNKIALRDTSSHFHNIYPLWILWSAVI
jgi:hypothetical protein